MNHQAPSKHRKAPRARGFTLIETVLAMVLGAMVMVGTLGVFLSLRNMESAFSNRYQRTSELDITHTIFTRAMLSLQMDETQTTTIVRASDDAQDQPQEEDLEPEPRFRMILETDTTVAPDSTGWLPQRFELVNATPPVPASLATQAAGWYVAQDQSETLDFSAMDGSQGIVRGVFELRRAGERERLMQSLGLINANDPILDDLNDLDQPQANTRSSAGFGATGSYIGSSNNGFADSAPKPNWTLWWRPILSYEGDQLLYGQGPFPDTIGTPDEIRARLAGAVPMMRNIERCIWEMFKSDEFVSTFAGLTMSDLPAYAQFEVILTNGQYASWMFEVDWVLGNDPSTDGTETDASDDDQDNQNGNNPGDPGPDDRRPPTGPQGGGVFNLGDS